MACNAYMADVIGLKHMTKRVAILTGFFFAGFNIGRGLSGVINNELGFTYNFGFGILVSVLTGAYALIFLKDSISIREERIRRDIEADKSWDAAPEEQGGRGEVVVMEVPKTTRMTKLTQLFSLNNVREGFRLVKPHIYTSQGQ